jgi:hypothetical protein
MRLVAEVDRELTEANASRYTHRKHVNEAEGVFNVDCVGFVVYALSRAAPEAVRPLRKGSRHRRPLAEDEDQKRSGQTLAGFSRSIGIPKDRLRWWKKRLSERKTERGLKPRPPSQLVPVRILESRSCLGAQASLDRRPLEVELASGHRIRIPLGLEHDRVLALVRALVTSC